MSLSPPGSEIIVGCSCQLAARYCRQHNRGELPMLTVPFNPRQEKEALATALCRFHERWEQRPSIHAFLDLCNAVERANEVVATLETQGEAPDRETRLQMVCLKYLLTS